MNETFEDIFKACYSPLVKYLQRTEGLTQYDAEDIVSESFLLMYQKWDTLEQHTKGAMYRWATLTARNLLKNQNRKKAKEELLLGREQERICGEPLYQEESDSEEEYAKHLSCVRTSLNQKEQELFDCKILQRMTDVEIAEHLHISLGSLRTRWSRLRKKLAINWEHILKKS